METYEEQETRADKEVTLHRNISLSSPGEAVVLSPPPMADDFRQFLKLMKHITDMLQIPLEEVQDSLHKLLDILHTSAYAQVALPVNEALLEAARTIFRLQLQHPLLVKIQIWNFFVVGSS